MKPLIQHITCIMPTLWKYLLFRYLKILILSLVSFISILLVTRLDDVARYAILADNQWQVLAFILYQVTYVTPLALPIASLVSAMVLFQTLSHTQELTALRTAGLSLRRITMPLLLTATFLSLVNIYIDSELATQSHLASRQMQHDYMSMNPFVLLKNDNFLRFKDSYVNIKHLSQDKERAHDATFALYDKARSRINLIIADDLILREDKIHGKNIGIISTFPSSAPDDYDQLLIENQDSIISNADGMSLLIKESSWNFHPDHLRLPLLLINIARLKEAGSSQILQQCYTDIARRISTGLAVLTFTMMGTAFGMEISRNRSKKGIIFVITLGTIFLACLFTGKNISQNFFFATSSYLIPHILIVASSIWTIKRIMRGQE
jgi:lipopolysaccharide export system permease protein